MANNARTVTQVISLKRAAHHAFIAWMCSNVETPLVFFNNVIPSLPPRLRETEPFNFGAAQPPLSEDAGEVLLNGDCDVIVNFEGRWPKNIDRLNEQYIVPQLSGRLRRIVFLRDPVNTLASLAKRTSETSFRSLYAFYGQLLVFEAIVRRLRNPTRPQYDRVVLFSAWQKSPAYRSELASYLALKTSALPAKVTSAGGGSSFAGMDFDPAAEQEALFERWRLAESNPLFLACFADERALKSMRQYFDLFAGVESVDPGIVGYLAQRAAAEPRAQRIARRVLQPLRRARGQIAAMERAKTPAAKAGWIATLQMRTTMGI